MAGIFSLQLLGGVWLKDEHVLITGPAAHRHRLALLALLAHSQPDGLSRDKLVAYLWSERDSKHARNLLKQAVHALRQALGDNAILGAGDELRLNSSVVRTDLVEFNDAVARGDRARAVELYRGDFLDGFFLKDAPEFEHWVDRERTRLADICARCLETLAEKAEERADYGGAVLSWKARAAHDPYDSRVALRLARALDASGNRAAAIQHAAIHEQLLREELGMEPAPELKALADRLRSEPRRSEALVEQQLGMHSDPAVATVVEEVRAEARAEPPTGFQSQPVANRPPQHRVSHRHWASYAIGGTALVTLVAIATAVWLRPTVGVRAPPVAADASIAVLPFTNVSGAPQDAALVDGLTEELIAVLAKVKNLRVIARTSAFAFKNSDAGVRRIADSLGVSNLLEGSVQEAGSHLRVQVRLVDARDGSTRWSETYDRESKDVFAVQSDIAGAVARALDLQLRPSTLATIRRGSTSNVAAHELYLRGNDPALLRSDSGARAGLEYFRQAIALDSGYAAAYAGLARMRLRSSFGNDKELPVRERLALAEQAALKAVALDDSLGEAHAALGHVRRMNYDMAAAETELRRAVELEPTNAWFHESLVLQYVATERPADALVEARRALELDPLSPSANAEVAHALLANNRCDEALAQLDKLRSLRPPLLRASNIAAQCYARKQMWPAAIAELQRTSANAGARGQALLGYMLARAGRIVEARQILTALLDRSRRIDGGAFEVAIVYAGLRENDQAFTWLDKAVDDRSVALDFLSAVVDDLRPDPRFDRFRRRTGLQKR